MTRLALGISAATGGHGALREVLQAPRLRALYDYWDARRGGASAMPRAALDPTGLPRDLLPHLIILDVLEEGAELRYRLVGTAVVEAIGREFTGETVSHYRQQHEQDDLAAGYRRVVATGRPDHYFGDLRNVGREHVTYERLALSMTFDGQTVDQILAGFAFSTPTPGSPATGQ